jgi:hypothetical protein
MELIQVHITLYDEEEEEEEEEVILYFKMNHN